MCHIDLNHCFWSLRLPEAFWGAFRISDGEGGVLSFRCLPFGWKYSLILCQKVLERLVEEIGLVGVLVLIYIDNVLIVGRGKGHVRGQAMRAVQALRAVGGVISPKSTLEPVTRLVWLGKDVDMGGGSLQTAGNAWEALLAHWLRLFVGVCSVRRLQQFLGRAQWICRPPFGRSPHLSGVWAHVLPPPPPPPSAVHLGQVVALYVRGVCVGFAGLVSDPPAERGTEKAGVCVCSTGVCARWEFFSMELGSRSAVPHEQPPNQQCAEALAVLWGLKFILNVGIREAYLFGDNAVALLHFLRLQSKCGACVPAVPA